MKRNTLSLALAGLLAVAALTAHAETPDPSGQSAIRVASTRTQAQVQAELKQFQQNGFNPWADEYNPLEGFHSTRTRAEVQQEYLAMRDEVDAMMSEHGGTYPAPHKPLVAHPRFAGQPVKAE